VKFCGQANRCVRRRGSKAFIVLKEGVAISSEEIMSFVNSKIAPFKAIHEVEFRKELLLSAAGKVLKRLLQEKS
jgi:long-chain acyl-CoA synthetase